MSIVLAGHETTASELAWAFQLLAHNPRVLNKLIDEIDGDGAGEEYLTATIQEVLRHRPVFLFTIPRAVKQPIEIGGWTYRPPTQLLGCIYLVHHDPELYPEPHEFRPERFLGDRSPSDLHVAAVGWRPQALSRPAPGDARDEDRAAHGARDDDRAARRKEDRAPPLAERDRHPARGIARGARASLTRF